MLDHSDPGDEDDKVRHAFERSDFEQRMLSMMHVNDPVPERLDIVYLPAAPEPRALPPTNLEIHFETVARSRGWVSPEEHDKRVSELLNATNRELDRRRLAEAKLLELRQTISDLISFAHVALL